MSPEFEFNVAGKFVGITNNDQPTKTLLVDTGKGIARIMINEDLLTDDSNECFEQRLAWTVDETILSVEGDFIGAGERTTLIGFIINVVGADQPFKAVFNIEYQVAKKPTSATSMSGLLKSIFTVKRKMTDPQNPLIDLNDSNWVLLKMVACEGMHQLEVNDNISIDGDINISTRIAELNATSFRILL